MGHVKAVSWHEASIDGLYLGHINHLRLLGVLHKRPLLRAMCSAGHESNLA